MKETKTKKNKKWSTMKCNCDAPQSTTPALQPSVRIGLKHYVFADKWFWHKKEFKYLRTIHTKLPVTRNYESAYVCTECNAVKRLCRSPSGTNHFRHTKNKLWKVAGFAFTSKESINRFINSHPLKSVQKVAKAVNPNFVVVETIVNERAFRNVFDKTQVVNLGNRVFKEPKFIAVPPKVKPKHPVFYSML
jgi:hypothetical protein